MTIVVIVVALVLAFTLGAHIRETRERHPTLGSDSSVPRKDRRTGE